MKTRVLRLNCITTAALSALLIAIGVFLGNLGNTEYKSQMKKRKARKIEKSIKTSTEQLSAEQSSTEQLTTDQV